MKTFNFYKLFSLLFIAAVTFSCVQDDDFDVPDTQVLPAEIDGTVISIGALRNQLVQEQEGNGNDFITFTETNQFISGFVISSDEGGNFFEELIIQDSPSNPEAGVKILADVNPLFTTYQVGRKVFVRLDGLTVGIDGGVLSLGIGGSGSDIEKIASSQLDTFLIRDTEVAEIVPLPISIEDFDVSKTNLFVSIQNVQFSANEVVTNQLTYAGESTDQFDGERTLQDCATGLSTVFSTSTFADFKSLKLPAGQGTINGILTLNFFGDQFNVTVNDPRDVLLTEERCDLCGFAANTETGVLFGDDFSTQTSGAPISGNGWTNFSEEGSVLWEAFVDENPAFGLAATVGAFGSNDESTVSWLVSPALDLDAQENETLNFDTSNSFSDNSYLLVLYSQDWDGQAENIPNATWLPILDATVVDDDTNFREWVASGNIDLSCLSGTAHIAFKYVGNDVDDEFNGTFELDNVFVNAAVETTTTVEAIPYNEDFEAYSNFGGLINAGWTNQNISGGNTQWSLGEFESNKYAQISGFSSGESQIDVWMVTPGVDFENTQGEVLTMDIQTNFQNAEILTVFYSTDFEGDATTATWTQLPVTVPPGPTSGFGTFTNVGDIDVSALSGTVYFGFFYEGSDPSATTRYHIDNFSVTGN